MRKGYHGPLARSKNSPPPEFTYAPPLDEGLDIVHVDDDVLVLSKPANLLSVPGNKEDHADCLETRALNEFPTARIVHRLDRGTSGIFIMARRRMSAAAPWMGALMAWRSAKARDI